MEVLDDLALNRLQGERSKDCKAGSILGNDLKSSNLSRIDEEIEKAKQAFRMRIAPLNQAGNNG